MDTLASLALATELPTPDLLERKPYGRTSPLISATMAKNILGQAIYQLVIVFGIMFFGEIIFDIDNGRYADLRAPPSVHFTIIFNAFVMMTLFNEINARKIHGQRNVFIGFFSNPIYYVIWIVTFLSQIVIIQWGGPAFSTAQLTIEQWVWCILFGVGTLVWQQVITTIPTSAFGKSMELGSQPPDMSSPCVMEDSYNNSFTGHHPVVGRSGQILWIRGLTRLQTQLRVIRAFKSTLEDMEEKRSCHSMHSLRSQRSHLTRPTSDISYIDDEERARKGHSSQATNGHYIRASTHDPGC